VGERPYDSLAAVYAWLVPDAMLEPEGAAAAFAGVTDELAPGARVLDCAAGTGQLAVGLALRGFDVTATDASAGMIAATRALAAHRGVDLRVEQRAWEELTGTFDAVLCVGNSLAHAAGRERRRAALAAMARVLAGGGVLAVTSRNWEQVRAAASRLEVGEQLVRRGGRAGLPIHAWTIAEAWDAPHRIDIAVTFPDAAGDVETVAESLAFWPFRHAELDEDLRAAGLDPATSTYAPDAERYLVTARRASAGARAG
jgi:SAM-dependent methyltransferase